MIKKQKKRERAKIATVTLMVVSVLLAGATLAVAELKKAEKSNQNPEIEISKNADESNSAAKGNFSDATAFIKTSR